LSLLGILMVQIGFAQQKTITGPITDESGIPLPGATVVIENTTRGVSSDFDGNFTIELKSKIKTKGINPKKIKDINDLKEFFASLE